MAQDVDESVDEEGRHDRPVTLADVARIAGVSTTTVSHVINRTRKVSPDTRRRVEQGIVATGYRTNVVARALRRATTESIGFVASDITNQYATAVIRGIESAARKARHTLLLANSDGDPELEADAIRALTYRQVDGLIVALTAGVRPDTVDLLRTLGSPVVLVDHALDVPMDQVLVENVESVRAMVLHLARLGHRRIAMVAGIAGNSTTVERIRGWCLAHEDAGFAIDEDLVAHGGGTVAGGEAAMLGLLGRPERPSAVFVANNAMAIGVLRALRQRGLLVPDDVALAAFDDADWAEALESRLTTVRQPTFEIGTEAVRLLLRRLVHSGAKPKIVRMEPELVHRDSCGDARSHASYDVPTNFGPSPGSGSRG